MQHSHGPTWHPPRFPKVGEDPNDAFYFSRLWNGWRTPFPLKREDAEARRPEQRHFFAQALAPSRLRVSRDSQPPARQNGPTSGANEKISAFDVVARLQLPTDQLSRAARRNINEHKYIAGRGQLRWGDHRRTRAAE